MRTIGYIYSMPFDAYDTIFQQFPSADAEVWKNKIIKDLKGGEFEKLIWTSPDDIEVLPFYTKEDTENYRLEIPEKKSQGWEICEKISVADCAKANKMALHALEQGATSIVFNLHFRNFTPQDIDILLDGILLDVAPVNFEHYIEEEKHYLKTKVPGSCPHFVIVPQHFSLVEELVYALEYGTKSIHENIVFRFFTCQHYFFEIAKLRAFRWLWKQVADLNKKPLTTYIQSETGLLRRADENEYNNMLRNTTEAMSAILGGCDSLIINSHDIEKNDTEFGKRIARNIHHILLHEANFSDIHQAAKGSYFIEYLTFQLAQKTWERFRHSIS